MGKNSSYYKPTLEFSHQRALWQETRDMPVWCILCLHTWTPGVKKQDKLNPRQLSEAQAVAADRCIGGRADGQGQRVPGGAGDCSAPAWNVNIIRQTKDSPGSILLGGLGTCVEQGRTDIDYMWVKHLLPGGLEILFFPKTPPKFSPDISGISCQAWTASSGNST